MENLVEMDTDENPELEPLDIPAGGFLRCDHGNRIVPGEETARYCSGCNPASNRILAPRHVVPEIKRPERELDTFDYMALPLHDRLTAGSVYLDA